MVSFKDAKPDKKNYRKFKIKTFKGQDDFAAVNEVVTRRYKRLIEERSSLPDLVMIDGDQGKRGKSSYKRLVCFH
jgi:excinuclease ABC subunit C